MSSVIFFFVIHNLSLHVYLSRYSSIQINWFKNVPLPKLSSSLQYLSNRSNVLSIFSPSKSRVTIRYRDQIHVAISVSLLRVHVKNMLNLYIRVFWRYVLVHIPLFTHFDLYHYYPWCLSILITLPMRVSDLKWNRGRSSSSSLI